MIVINDIQFRKPSTAVVAKQLQKTDRNIIVATCQGLKAYTPLEIVYQFYNQDINAYNGLNAGLNSWFKRLVKKVGNDVKKVTRQISINNVKDAARQISINNVKKMARQISINNIKKELTLQNLMSFAPILLSIVPGIGTAAGLAIKGASKVAIKLALKEAIKKVGTKSIVQALKKQAISEAKKIAVNQGKKAAMSFLVKANKGINQEVKSTVNEINNEA